jgi:sugar-specific transcriptional regulator TrmB
MRSKLLKTLKDHGLKSTEAAAYLSLLGLAEATPAQIARNARLPRPTAYLALDTLSQMGLIASVRKQRKLSYRALSPYMLLERSRDRHAALKDAMPELSMLAASAAESRPHMSVFEGPRGLVQMMEDTLGSKTPILYWADMTLVVSSIFKNYWPEYIRKRVERGITTRGILSGDALALEFKKRGTQELREAVLMPKKRFPFKNEINIYDHKVAIISHNDLLGVIIENRNIAETQRSIFEFAYEYAVHLEPQTLKEIES